MAESQWNVQRAAEQFGPFSWNEIVDLARQGRIDPGDLLWRNGDQASREARSVPGLLAVMPGGATSTAPKKGAAVGAVLAVVALVAGLIFVGSRSSDEQGGAEGSSDTTAPQTTHVPSTPAVTTTIATTTIAPTTIASTVAETTTTSPATTTIAPTTTVRIVTGADLAAAFPNPNALPTGWTSIGQLDLELIPASGPGIGSCGLDNRDARSQQYGVVAVARAPRMAAPDTSEFSISLIAFPTDLAASGFVTATAVQGAACKLGFPFSVIEGGDGPDFFGDPAADGTTWNALETHVQAPDEVPGADASLVYESATDWNARFQGTDYGFRDVSRYVFEQYGTMVLVGRINSVESFNGFEGFDAPILTTTTQGLLSAMDLFRPEILANLRTTGLVD